MFKQLNRSSLTKKKKEKKKCETHNTRNQTRCSLRAFAT